MAESRRGCTQAHQSDLQNVRFPTVNSKIKSPKCPFPFKLEVLLIFSMIFFGGSNASGSQFRTD